jgi:hypothetical protein
VSVHHSAVARGDWNWSRTRPIAFWATTFVIVFELAAGSVWNLMAIEWIEVQMIHLGYPHYFAYISGWWQDPLETWGAPLMFTTCGIASWVLRPAARRLPRTWLLRVDAGRDGTDPTGTRPRAWAISIGILVVLYVVSFLTLPAVEEVMHENAVELGWIDE